MSLFSASEINTVTSGAPQTVLVDYLGEAMAVTALGVLCFMTAYFLFRLQDIRIRPFDACQSSLANFWFAKSTLSVACVLMLVFMISLMALGAKYGKARTFALEHRGVLFLFNIYNQFASFLLFVGVVYARIRPGFTSYAMALAFFACSLFFGTRGSSVVTLAIAIFCIFAANRSRKFGRAAIFAAIAAVGGILVSILRGGGDTDVSVAAVGAQFFYGNTFSDVRDFAWMLSGWDENFALGKTYLSGFFSFIPSSIFPARSAFGWSNFSASVTGMDLEVHPGFRPGAFGEAYFNFGLLGVVLVAFFAGGVLGAISRKAQVAATASPGSREALITVATCFLFMGFIPHFFFTAGFFGFYVKILLILFGLAVHHSIRSYREYRGE